MKQPVIWVTNNLDGTRYIEIDENGKETLMDSDFLKEHKHEFSHIGLIDVINNLKYAINLNNGKLILNGQEFGVSKEHRGIKYYVSGRDDIDYRGGVIQYKCSKPMYVNAALLGVPIQSEIRTFNIGYKVDLPEDFLSYEVKTGKMDLIKCIAEISVDADTLQPSLSIGFTARLTREDGSTKLIRI